MTVSWRALRAPALVAMLASLALPFVGGAQAQQPIRDHAFAWGAGTVSHVWRPRRDSSAQVVAIDVHTTVNGLSNEVASAFTLNVPITYAGVRGIADRVQQLTVRDASGDVPLALDDDGPHPGGFPHYRHYRARRPVTWPVTIAYSSLAPRQLVGGPPFGLYAAYGGVSGAGSGFLVLPEAAEPVISRVHWDLSDLAPGARAATTFGEGDFELRAEAAQLRQGWIMAGPVGRYPDDASTTGFRAFWLGTPSWDPPQELAWAARMFAWLGQSYRYLDPLPDYRVFVRVGGRGGTALGSSFMVGATPRAEGAAATGTSPRTTITHEMGHLFVGGIDAPLGESSWFSEGLNVYYTRLLPMRGGFESVDDYAHAVNRDFREYYFGAARNLSADSIVRVGFADEKVRHIPYVRGSMYFADLDTKIRAHSNGRRTLDQVLYELFARRQRGEPFNHAVWIETVVREAGPLARDDFEGIILRGDRTVVPASGAFGPCLERRATAPATVDGTVRGPGFEWVRKPGVSDERCRAPW